MVLVLSFCAAWAQTTSSISGVVRDSTSAVVPGAKIALLNEVDHSVRSLRSNAEGFFQFSAVQPGTFSVSISMTGFQTWTVTGIEVHPGDALTVSKILMTIGNVVESVTVTAEVAGVNASNGEHSNLITSGDINRLSTTGRDVAELVSILPGFTINAGVGIQNQGADYQTMGFGSGQVKAYGANGAAPQQGLVSIVADGANVIDPGDMGGQISNVNMDQVQEVKVSTSNFGADQAKGPIVINAVGKAGGAAYHGGLYTYLRNGALNSNDWLSNYYQQGRPNAKYYYPGATLGGPVKIPGTHFNDSKRLVFWTGFEYYGQQNVDAMATAFIPPDGTDPKFPYDMLGGDVSPAAIANALNLSEADLTKNCSASYSQTDTYSNIGGLCWSPSEGSSISYDQNGSVVVGGKLKNIDPAVKAFTRYYPKINRTPRPVVTNGQTQFASDGYNYVQNVMASHNGFQFHGRVDENISDTLKLYGTYNWEKINDEQRLNNIYYNPTGTIPYPTPLFTNTGAQYLTLNLTKIITSSLTNELVVSGVYFNQPKQFAKRSLALDTGTPWEAAGYSGGQLKNGTKQLPRIVGYESVGIPSFAMGYVPDGSEFLRKYSVNLSDNVTKQFKTHSIKLGFYAEQTGNNQVTLGSQANGTLSFMRWDGCYVNEPPYELKPNETKPPTSSLGNQVAAFLSGCPLGYQQDAFDPNINLRFTSIEGYATDEWKLTSKLTLTVGMRLSHLGPWTDKHGVGIAVWNPAGVDQKRLYDDVTADPRTWHGIDWHKKNSNIPVAGVPTRPLFYSPRFGLAYDMYGDAKTVFRGGWGVYHSHDPVGTASGGASTAVGLETSGIPGSVSCTLGQLFTTAAKPCGTYYTAPGGSVAPFVINAANPKDDRLPVTYNYNFTLDQLAPFGSTFEIAYVGNQSSSLSTLGNLQNQNVIPLNAFFGTDPITGQTNPPTSIPNSANYRPYPNYQAINVPTHLVWANYNSLQTGWNKQKGALITGVNYTWSKAMGVRGNWDTGYISDPVNPHNDYGIVAFDRPHVLNATYSWQEGNKFHVNRLFGTIINGWEFSGITSVQSGPDLAVVNGSTNFSLQGGVNYTVGSTSRSIPVGAAQWLGSSDYSLQPTVKCDPRLGLSKNQFVKGSCFGLPELGSQGVWNLPATRGPAYFKSDLSVYKNVQVNDRQNMQFRLSGFNFLNHPITSFNNNNLSTLNLVAGNGEGTYSTPQDALANVRITNAETFGATEFKVGARIVELGFKYNF